MLQFVEDADQTTNTTTCETHEMLKMISALWKHQSDEGCSHANPLMR